MSKKIPISPSLILALAAGMQPNVGFGYDIAVHDNMTGAAFNLAYSPATVPEFLGMLGIRPAQTFLGNPPRQWIIQGSKDEDNFALPRFHFFDPGTLFYRPTGNFADSDLIGVISDSAWEPETNQQEEQFYSFSLLGVFRSNLRYFDLMWWYNSVDGSQALDASEMTAPVNNAADAATVNF